MWLAFRTRDELRVLRCRILFEEDEIIKGSRFGVIEYVFEEFQMKMTVDIFPNLLNVTQPSTVRPQRQMNKRFCVI